jgi:hypothetical protein
MLDIQIDGTPAMAFLLARAGRPLSPELRDEIENRCNFRSIDSVWRR